MKKEDAPTARLERLVGRRIGVVFMALFADDDTQRKLIEACNLLCDFAGEKLPSGWEIQLHMTRGEAWIDLIEPGGESIDCTPEVGMSSIDHMCVTAIEADALVDAEGVASR